MPLQTVTTNSLSGVLEELVRKVASEKGISESLAERLFSPTANGMANIAGISTSNSAYLSEKVNEMSTYLFRLQDFVRNGVGSKVVEGLDVIATNPPSSRIRVTQGTAYIDALKVTVPKGLYLDVDLTEPNSYYVFLNQAGTIAIDHQLPDLALILARVEIPSAYASYVENDYDLGEEQVHAYIVSAKDPLFDNNYRFDDDSIAQIRNVMQELFAENIFGTIKLHENLTIENIAGSLAMDSKQVLIKDPSGNTLSKFNANGTFYYNSLGEEFAHYGRDGARVGNIRITPQSLESVNFSTGQSGFRIDAGGSAEFNDVTVRGTIYAGQGEIGGWTIGTTKLSAGNIDIDSIGIIKIGTDNDVAVLNAYDAQYRHWIGHINPISAPFSVKKDGSLRSIKGSIGGWDIKDTELESTNIVLSTQDGGKITAGNVQILGQTSTIQVGTGVTLNGSAYGLIEIGSGISISGDGGGTLSVGDGVTLNGETGSITATIGQIAGWSLSDNQFFSDYISIKAENGGSIQVGSILLDGAASTIGIGSAVSISGVGHGSIQIGNGISMDGELSVIELSESGQFKAGDTTLNSYGLSINGVYSHISIGSGNTVIKINNEDGLYLGNTVRESAPFWVNMQGELTATAGIIAGWSVSSSTLTSPGNSIIIDSQNRKIDIGGTIRLDGLNQRAESINFQSGINGWRLDGQGNAEFQNCTVRGRLHTAIFVKDEIHATNGQLLVSDAASLKQIITPSTTKLYISEAVFFAGDRLRMKTSDQDELIKVVSVGSDGGGDYITVIRNLDNQGAYDWQIGTAIVSVESRVQIVASGSEYLPYIDVIERTDDTTEASRARLGNLAGISGASGYGLWSENVFLTGKITAISGSIGGWDIDGSQLKSQNDKIILDSTQKKITAGTIIIDGEANKIDVGAFIDILGSSGGQIVIGNTESVYLDGASGKIVAKKGDIGGWQLSASSLVSDSGAVPIIGLESGNTGKITVSDGTSIHVTLGKYDSSNYGLKAGDAVLNSNGLTISGTSSSLSLGTGNAILKFNNTEGLYLGNVLQALAPFSVTMAGVLKAVSGTVGGWALSTSTLSSANIVLSNSGVITVGSGNDLVVLSSVDSSYRLWAGHSVSGSATFRVHKDGTLYASNAEIEGTIKASSGYIGSSTNGWQISSNALTNIGTGIIQTDSHSTIGIKLDSVSLRGYDGSNERFRLKSDGSGYLGASSTFSWNIAGTVYVGGFTVNSNSLIAGSGSNTVGISTGSYSFYAGNSNPASAPFRVTPSGNLYAGNAVITGDFVCNTLTATQTGILAGWNITSTALIASSGGKIKTSSDAETNGLVLDNAGLRGYGGGVQKFALTASNGRLFANEADIGRKITKITSTSNVGSAINSAIAQFGSDGGIIYIPSGTYRLDTTINMEDNITIKGSGPDQTTLVPDLNMGTMIDISWNTDNVEILDLEMDASYGSYTASKCINISGSGGIENLRLKNCVFRDATSVNVDFSYAGRETIEGCVFYVASGAIGIDGATNITACEFNGSGTGISGGAVVSNCEFNNLSIGVNYALQLVNNRFYNCGTCYYQQYYSEGNIIRGNLFRGYTSKGISFTSRNFLFTITDNIFDGGSGISVELGAVFSGIVSNNNFYEHSGSYIIHADYNSTEYLSHAPSLNITGNMIYRCSVSSGFFSVNLTHHIESRNSLLVSNNTIKSCTVTGGGSGIKAYDPNAVIANNVITEVFITNSSASFYFIDVYEKAHVTGNMLAHIDLPGGGSNFIVGVRFNWVDSVYSNNIIIFDADSTSTLRGFYQIGGAERTSFTNNRISVKNSGSGNGEAFYVSISEGLAVGNNYVGSDSLGTLSISSGIVANNNG